MADRITTKMLEKRIARLAAATGADLTLDTYQGAGVRVEVDGGSDYLETGYMTKDNLWRALNAFDRGMRIGVILGREGAK